MVYSSRDLSREPGLYIVATDLSFPGFLSEQVYSLSKLFITILVDPKPL